MSFKRVARTQADLFGVAQALVGLPVDKPLLVTVAPVKSHRSEA